MTIKAQLRECSQALGFNLMKVAPVELPLKREYYKKWIEEGLHGDMYYMGKDIHRRLYPSEHLSMAKSIVCFGLNYFQEEPGRRGRIAKYALGKDYHKLMVKKLKQVCLFLKSQGGNQKICVDTGYFLEKPIAEQADLGWMGKSTILINKKWGTWLFLGIILTTLEIEPDLPSNKSYCGKCTACIDVCPTKAIRAPYQLDATKCISYLTIEHKGSIPVKYRKLIGDHLYGCDDCLDVCPWNRWAQKTKEAKFDSIPRPDLNDMLYWTDDDFLQAFQGTAIMRLKLSRWLRNVCIVLGNIGKVEDLQALHYAAHLEEPLVKEHALWAINEIEKKQN